MLFKKFKNIFILLIKLFYFNTKARFTKKNNTIVLVPEFDFEGGALTYFRYLIEYFEAKDIKYYLVLSKSQKDFVVNNFHLTKCIDYFIGPSVWRPHFTRKKGLATNLDLLVNQLQELYFFSKLNLTLKPDYFYFSVTNPEHYLFEFSLPTKVFYVCHTLTYDKLDFLKKGLINWYIGKNKRIIVVSKFAKKKIIESWNIPVRKINNVSVVYNYYESPQVNFQKEHARDSFNILTIGSLEDFKNPLLWCDIAIEMSEQTTQNNIHFYWVGNGSLLSTCKERVIKYDNIHFVGFKQEVEFYYRIADVYIQPSKTESFGISVAGAMAYKLPCIVNNIGGLTELVINEQTGYVISSNLSDQYIVKLKNFISDSNLGLQMGSNGFERYKQNFIKKLWTNKMNCIIGTQK